ncbi:MAG: ABC transporter permease [Firmicutes bacterium]|nr:ABC transporter permease [Bacillota bacterium]
MSESHRTNSLKYELKALVAFLERAVNLFKRYIGWEVVALTYANINVITIGLIGVAAGDPQRALYLTIGAILWGYLSITFQDMAETISWERWEGTIEYTLMAPISRVTHLAGSCFSTVMYGLVRTGIILLVVSQFLNINLSKANFLSAAVILAISSLPFLGLGLVAAVLPLLSPEKGTQATHIFQALLMLVSGVYYEVTVLPAWVQSFSVLSPATYTLKAMRLSLLEGAGLYELRGYITILLVLGLIFLPLGYMGFRLGENYARRTGKLSRSG